MYNHSSLCSVPSHCDGKTTSSCFQILPREAVENPSFSARPEHSLDSFHSFRNWQGPVLINIFNGLSSYIHFLICQASSQFNVSFLAESTEHMIRASILEDMFPRVEKDALLIHSQLLGHSQLVDACSPYWNIMTTPCLGFRPSIPHLSGIGGADGIQLCFSQVPTCLRPQNSMTEVIPLTEEHLGPMTGWWRQTKPSSPTSIWEQLWKPSQFKSPLITHWSLSFNRSTVQLIPTYPLHSLLLDLSWEVCQVPPALYSMLHLGDYCQGSFD